METNRVTNEYSTKDIGLAAALVINRVKLLFLKDVSRKGGTGGQMKTFVFEMDDAAKIERIRVQWAGSQLEGNLVDFWEAAGRLRKMLHRED